MKLAIGDEAADRIEQLEASLKATDALTQAQLMQMEVDAKRIAELEAQLEELRKQEPINEPTAAAQLMNSVAESNAFAEKYINSNRHLVQECKDADELLRLLNLDPEIYRTEFGFINLPKIRAALRYPDQYPRTTRRRE